MEAAVERPYLGDQEQEEKRVVLLESSTAAAAATHDDDDDHREAHGKEESVLKAETDRAAGQKENNEMKSSSPGQKELSFGKQISTTNNIKGSSLVEPDHSVASTSSSRKEQDYQLESARAEMGEVREENQRLKKYLDQMMEDYQTLQLQYHDIQQKATQSSKDAVLTNNHQDDDESEALSLSLGYFSAKQKRVEEKSKSPSAQAGKEKEADDEKSLSLGLDCKYEAPAKSSSTTTDQVPLSNPSPASSIEEVPKEEAGETWPPKKVLKTMRSMVEDEVAQQSPVKRARVSVRARCDTPTMNDGCQWRKYGQKIAKGNPCPRAYYRCTIAPSCPVRKQVQRCAEDMSILITTYEGVHNHPLPMSATAMASTTSAAASMLLSGSSSSSSRSGLNTSVGASTAAADLHGYNYYVSDNSRSRFYVPNSSMSSSLPTITLDLTSNPSSSSSSSHMNKFASSTLNSAHQVLYPPTSLNFGSSDQSNNVMSWTNNGFLSYGNGTQLPYNNKNHILGRQQQQQPMQNSLYQNYMQKNSVNPTPLQFQLPDPIAAATKAITADPSFQSALAAALTSIIGSSSNGGSGSSNNNQNAGGDHFNNIMAQKLKWGENFPGISSSNSATASSFLQTAIKGNNITGCGSSYLSKPNSSSATFSQPGGLMFLQPPNSLPFATHKSASTSPSEDHKS